MVKIGNLELEGRAVLAPMAGVTDRAFRELCTRFGASYVVSEMVSSKGLQYNDKNTGRLMELGGAERPAGIQLFGDEPAVLALAAKKAMAYHPDVIDINMGCPVPKVAGNGSGSALMKNPPLCGEIVAAVKRAVPVPVTVKSARAGTATRSMPWRSQKSARKRARTPSRSMGARATRCMNPPPTGTSSGRSKKL